MAKIRPFRGIRYNPEKIRDLSRVVTQPYDKITPEKQEEYYQRDEHNVVRVTLGKEELRDDEDHNKYSRAKEYLGKWLQERVLLREETPSLYAYYQTFTTPTGEEKTRKGLIAHLILEPFGSGVRPHEETLSKPKADRLNLLRTARVNTGQIFMLYSDPGQQVNQILTEETQRAPEIDWVAEDGVREKVWVIQNPNQVSLLVEIFVDKQLLIADGHHRYETALTYQEEMKTNTPHYTGEEGFNFRMVTLVSMEDPGLVILPTHRLIHQVEGFNLLDFLKKAEQFFRIEPQKNQEVLFDFMKTEENQSFGVYGEKKYYLLNLKDRSILDQFIKGSSVMRSLDVAVLHSLLIESSERGAGNFRRRG